MNDPIDINLLNWEERAAIHAQDTTVDDYGDAVAMLTVWGILPGQVK